MKLVLPLAALNQGPIHFPGVFLRFIGAAELAGALGLVLPGLFRTRVYLTPLAAAGLAVIMVGATVVTVMAGAWLAALFPAGVGILALTVYLGRGGLGGVFRAPASRAALRAGI